MELLEERPDALIMLEDDHTVHVVQKNPYNLLKYKYFQGRRIRFVSNNPSFISIEETEIVGEFQCIHNGKAVTIRDSKFKVASAILECQLCGNIDPIHNLWKLEYAKNFLNISIATGSNFPVELTREGKLLLPESIPLLVLDWADLPDGGRIVKVQLTRNTTTDRIFAHEQTFKLRTTRIMNNVAVALIGRDETGQCWMHVVPPEFRNRSIASCEMWLCGGKDASDELVTLK